MPRTGVLADDPSRKVRGEPNEGDQPAEEPSYNTP